MPIRSEALPYVLPPLLACAAAAAAGATGIAAGCGVLATLLGAFFRDPRRESAEPTGAVLSPADGKVVEVDAQTRFIAIFLSVFDVHVTRAPCAGRLLSWKRIEGGYALAFRAAASHNARCELLFDTDHGPLRLALMAGAVARRVVQWVRPGQRLERGERLAIIKFGSRAELTLPPTCRPVVSVGDRVRAGETVIARASSTSAIDDS